MHTLTTGTFHESDQQKRLSRARKISLDDHTDIVYMCHHPDHAIVDLVDHTFANILATFRIEGGKHIDGAFSRLLEDLNNELLSMHLKQSLTNLSLFLGIVHHGQLTFSLIGSGLTGILISPSSVDNILDGMSNEHDVKFMYDSKGQVTEDEMVLITPIDVMRIFSEDEFEQLIDMPMSKKIGLLQERITEANIQNNVAYILLGYDKAAEAAALPVVEREPTGNAARDYTNRAIGSTSTVIKDLSNRISRWFASLPENIQYGVFGLGIFVAVILLYMVISTALGTQKELFVPNEYQEMYEKAVVEVQEALNSTSNPEVFQGHIQEARTLLGTIQERNVLQAKVDELSTQISSLEKRFNQVTTASSYQLQQQHGFPEGFQLLHIFVHDGKQYYVGADNIIGPHIFGSTPETHAVPDGAKILFADIDDEGKIYTYTDAQQILEFQKGNFRTLEVSQVGGWDVASDIKSYNGNIYLLSEDGKQIFKHRKIASGFDGKSLMIQEGANEFGFGAVDFDIDGGVYLLKENALIDKVFSAPKYERRSIVINKLGTNVFGFDPTLGDGRKIVGNPDLEHVYVLLNGKVWIFKPNSARFSDVQSLEYVGQVEIPNIMVDDIWVIQDGDVVDVYFGNSSDGAYRMKLSIQDGNIEIL